MSKHVHPTLFRRGYPSDLSDTFERSTSKRASRLFERKDSYAVGANLKCGNLGRKIQQNFILDETVRDFFQKSGYLVEAVTSHWGNGTLVLEVSVYHRVSTSTSFKSSGTPIQDTSGHLRSPRAQRRPSWTTRILPWRSLFIDDFLFFKGFFGTYLGLEEGQFVLDIQMFSCIEVLDSPCHQTLALSLQPLQSQEFFRDTVAVLCRASKEPSAELLAQLLRMELGHLRNQQVILDAVSQGLQVILGLDQSLLKAFLIKVSGRINGADRAKAFQSRKGSMPLHTLKAPIDYGFAEVNTKYGILSIKIYLRY